MCSLRTTTKSQLWEMLFSYFWLYWVLSWFLRGQMDFPYKRYMLYIKSGRNFEIVCIFREIGYKKHMFRFVAFFSLLVIFFSLEIFCSWISMNDVFLVRSEMYTFFTIKCSLVQSNLIFKFCLNYSHFTRGY